MSSWRLRWLVIGPVLMFVLGATMLSCGGGGAGCSGTFDAFGNFVPGVCPSPGPGLGYSLEAISICPGPPPSRTPTPAPTKGTRTPTPTATPCPAATTTAVPVGTPGGLVYNAEGTFVNKGGKVILFDITNDRDTLWTSDHPDVLQAPAAGNGGVYNAIAPGCACADVSAGGISALPVGVTVFSSNPTPACGLCPTPIPTPSPSPTPKGVIPPAPSASAQPPAARIDGVLRWVFDAVMPLRSPIATAPDGHIYFLTLDAFLHAVDGGGKERWRRPSGGLECGGFLRWNRIRPRL